MPLASDSFGLAAVHRDALLLAVFSLSPQAENGQMHTLAVGSTRFGLEFDRYLQGTREVNAIRVVLPGGLLL